MYELASRHITMMSESFADTSDFINSDESTRNAFLNELASRLFEDQKWKEAPGNIASTLTVTDIKSGIKKNMDLSTLSYAPILQGGGRTGGRD
jgi:hypothetical protein